MAQMCNILLQSELILKFMSEMTSCLLPNCWIQAWHLTVLGQNTNDYATGSSESM